MSSALRTTICITMFGLVVTGAGCERPGTSSRGSSGERGNIRSVGFMQQVHERLVDAETDVAGLRKSVSAFTVELESVASTVEGLKAQLAAAGAGLSQEILLREKQLDRIRQKARGLTEDYRRVQTQIDSSLKKISEISADLGKVLSGSESEGVEEQNQKRDQLMARSAGLSALVKSLVEEQTNRASVLASVDSWTKEMEDALENGRRARNNLERTSEGLGSRR